MTKKEARKLAENFVKVRMSEDAPDDSRLVFDSVKQKQIFTKFATKQFYRIGNDPTVKSESKKIADEAFDKLTLRKLPDVPSDSE